MEVSKIPKFRKLTKEDRILIARWWEKGLSNKRIAGLLGRSISTIGREITRNRFKDWVYEPLHAQNLSEQRKKRAWGAKEPLKDPQIYSYVMEKLRGGWSPEQIAGRLRLVENKGSSLWYICSETIYHYIYRSENKSKRLWEYLRRKQVRRRLKGGGKSQRIRIPDRVSIHLRPEIVNQRTEIGHWEGNSIVGKGRTNGLHTTYERLTSLIKFRRMITLDSDNSIVAQLNIYRKLPESLRKSTMLDNGKEHVKHIILKKILGMATYFADPYSSWQRGGNENANLWIRYYFPKGTDFNQVTDEELREVEKELNNRPRKRLQYLKPTEVFNSYLRGCTCN